MVRWRLWLQSFAVALVLVHCSVGRAEEVHYDVFVTSTGNGTQLVIGGFDHGTSTANVPGEQMRVFGGETSGMGNAPYASDEEPGFAAGDQVFLNGSSMSPPLTYTALSGNTALAFNFQPMTIGDETRNLFFWSGNGSVAFEPVSADVTLDLGGALINGSMGGIEAGVTIANTGSDGSMDDHLVTTIANDSGAPAMGFYLFSIQMQMQDYLPSESIYFVYGAIDLDVITTPEQFEAFDALHEQAIGWVEVNVVPEPSTYALMGLAAAAIPLVRRFRAGR